MVRSGKTVCVAAGALAAVSYFQKSGVFVPGPLRSAAPAAGVTAATMLAPAAFADEIGDAAKKLAEASYPFAKEVDWNNGIFLQAPGAFKPQQALKAIDKMIVMGAQADPKLLKAAALAHHEAIDSIKGANGVTTKADWELVNAALGRVIASVPESTVMAVYNAVSDITDPEVPAYMKSLVKGEDADKAYAAFLEFKDVVKRNQVSSAGPEATAAPGKYRLIDAAAKKLSDASYPFLKDIDWSSDIYMKPLPGTTPQKVLQAVDKAIVMGASMDGNLLKAAAEAHHTALENVDGNLVTTPLNYEKVNTALGKAIASVPTSQVMDVYNAFAKVVPGPVPNMMFSMVDPKDANAAAKAFYEFKDVVKAAQR